MHQNATVAKWFKEHGRHEVFAGGKNVPLATTEHDLVIDPTAAAAVRPVGEGPQNAAEDLRMMKKMFNEMMAKKQGITVDAPVAITGLRKRKTEGVAATTVG
jgi:hypothetical protein